MTLFVTAMSMVIGLIVAGVSADAAKGATLRLRAQLAADAAALAAVAEALPYGRGFPDGAARRYAESNGGRLVECLCRPGATSMQVRVSLGSVEASARAVVDPALLMPLATTGRGLHPRLESALERLIAASDGSVWVTSGYRSTRHQAELWQSALARYGSAEAADDWVAPPGSSMHERGLAVDLGGDISRAALLVNQLRLPMHRPMAHEPWHFELVGSRGGTPGPP